MVRSCRIILILVVGLVTSIWVVATAAGQDDNATVLIYHKFGEEQHPTTNISRANFVRQMAYLREQGYQVLPLARIVDMLHGASTLPDKTVAITIDDGYESVYTVAWPILKQYGYPFTVFLYAKAVERKYRDFLTWQQIEEMQAAGVDFQDHGYNHAYLGIKPVGMTDQEYADWILFDLARGRAVLQHHLGGGGSFLALPYGEYNSIIADQCRKIGYRAVFSQDPGSVSSSTGYIIPREPILGYDWSTLAHFETILKRVDLPLADLLPDTKPFKGRADKFCATMLFPERYAPETLNVYVSELGWQRPKVDGNRICLTNDKVLKRRSNRVGISAREKITGRRAIHFWLLINQ